MTQATLTITTIGHSTHPIDEFIALLQGHDIRQLVDIRTIPHSRHYPQYEQAVLEQSLSAADIAYSYMKALGGLRPKVKNPTNLGWHNASFRNYADYMQTAKFAQAVTDLMKLAKQRSTAIMCAEAVPIQHFDLGFVPLAQLQTAGIGKTASQTLRTVLRPVFSSLGLEQFKNKFDPTWHTTYLAYDGDEFDVPAISTAVVSATRLTAQPIQPKNIIKKT
jgi:hypothetical protein